MNHHHSWSGSASHRHNLLVYYGEQTNISNVYGYSLPASNQGSKGTYAANPTYGSEQRNYISDTTVSLSGWTSDSYTTENNSTARKETDSTGNGEAVNILPPYEVAYCWKRVA